MAILGYFCLFLNNLFNIVLLTTYLIKIITF
nr:MAG TPA: hypothetical protein [Caudoviricetes sp.]